MSKARDIGTKFESATAKFFASVWPSIARIGSRDYSAGDLEGVPSFVLECKAETTWGKARVEKWIDQAEASRKRTGKPWKALIVRRKYHPMRKAHVIMDAGEFREMVEKYNIK